MDMLPVVSQMGILFAAVALGFIGAKAGVLRADSNEQLSKLVLNLTLPCSVLYSAMDAEKLLSNGQILLLTLVACVTAGALVLLAAGLARQSIRYDGEMTAADQSLYEQAEFMTKSRLVGMWGDGTSASATLKTSAQP